MEKLEKLEIPTIEFAKVTLLETGGSSNCGVGQQAHAGTTQGDFDVCESDYQGD